MVCRVWTSRRTFCAVCGASAILEMNRVNFLPTSINPQIDAAKDMGSMILCRVGVEWRSTKAKVASERTLRFCSGRRL